MITKRICVVITARPSYARIYTAMEALQRRQDIELKVVVSASMVLERFGNAANLVEQDGFEVSHRVFCMLEGGNLITSAKSTGLSILELTNVFQEMRPDAVITIADRFETLATATAASYLNIPLIHIQGGEVSGNIDNKVRNAITKLADLHLVSNTAARQRVIDMGEKPEQVHITGCPSVDLAARIAADSDFEYDIFERYKGVGAVFDLPPQRYFVVLQHPVTTEPEASQRQVEETLHAVRSLGAPTLWFWPNIDAGSDGFSHGIRAFREKYSLGNTHFFKHLPADDFLRLVSRSAAIVGNSSVGIRECAFLGVPAINIGDRQQGRDRGANVIDISYDRTAILNTMTDCLNGERPVTDPIYGSGDAGKRIAEVVGTAPLELKR